MDGRNDMKPTPAKLTYDDFVNFPDDGLRHELIDGEHYVTPSPSAQRCCLASRSGSIGCFSRAQLAHRSPEGGLPRRSPKGGGGRLPRRSAAGAKAGTRERGNAGTIKWSSMKRPTKPSPNDRDRMTKSGRLNVTELKKALKVAKDAEEKTKSEKKP